MASKIEPPALQVMGPQGLGSVRPELLDRLPAGWRYVAIVAPPGYGKSVVAREIHAACAPGTAAWLSVDLLDRQPFAFWSHLIAALRGTIAEIDDEPLDLLAERSASDFTFLASLSQQIRNSSTALLLVLDDVDRIDDPDVLIGIERLAEWCADRLRLVVTGRVDPALPLARWRAKGLLTALREDDLRFDRRASRRFADAFAPGLLEAEAVDALHDRVEGWPVALQVGLIVARESPDPAVAVEQMVATNRLLADYVTGEVLDALGHAEREVALGLSVLDWFDLDLCRDLLGADSLPALWRLLGRRIPLVELEDRRGYRFHSLIRDLLMSELRWRNPDRFTALHRTAGELMLARDDRLAAARHFVWADDPDRASEVVTRPAMDLIDAGRVDELRQILALLPPDVELTSADQAIGLAFGELLVGHRAATERRLRRAAELTLDHDDATRAQLLVVVVAERTLLGDAATALDVLAELDRLRLVVPGAWPLQARLDGVVGRIAQLLDLADADERIARIERSGSPQGVIDVVVPATKALLAFDRGDLRGASTSQAFALDRAADLESDAHPAVYQVMLASAQCAWAAGEFEAAREFCDRAFAHPGAGFPMWWLRIASVAVDCLVCTGAAAAAVDLIGQFDRADARFPLISHLADRVRAKTLIAVGEYQRASELLAPHPAMPERQLLLAWAEVGCGRHDAAAELVADIDEWPAHRRIEGLVVRSVVAATGDADAALCEALRLAAADGWVGPLLGHGSDVTERLRRLATGDLHRPLTDALSAAERSGSPMSTVDLTDREVTLLELLPTHLSYSQMGERLYLSVNTIKSNLKSVYRKLGASNRDEAIRSARLAGLLTDESV